MTVEVDIKKRLGDEFLLETSFSLENGITVLAGDSGAGKTTTLRLIAGILRPDEGYIRVAGRTYFDSERGIDIPIRERQVGFVFQDYALFPHLNAEQNIAYGAKSDSRAERMQIARSLLDQFRISHIRNQLPREMSGGEQQRVALARALASGPAIVLLDEPLSAVDVETRTSLLYEIEGAQKEANIPFIYVTHNQAEVERFGTQRIILENGRSSPRHWVGRSVRS